MVAGAHSMGALGVIRSLGRSGYQVHAVSSVPSAIGLRSNFAKYSVIHPSEDSIEFEDWISNYIYTHKIQLIIPGGPIAPGGHLVMNQYLDLFPLSSEKEILSKANKYELFATLLSGNSAHRDHLPPVKLVDFESELPTLDDLSELGMSLFMKLDGAHAKKGNADRVVRLESVAETLEALKKYSASYYKAIVQGFVPGTGVGVFILRWHGQVIAKFMHRRLHEMPHTGGASSLRESWWNEEIFQDAQAKLEYINWQGVAMIEYRWDKTAKRFYLMEMNLRFWGSIHLALYAGVDFPKLLADSFFGSEIKDLPAPKIGVKCRNTIPFEIGYLVSLWRDKNVSIQKKFYSLWEAVLLSLDFRVKNDFSFPGDRKLFWYRLSKFLKSGE